MKCSGENLILRGIVHVVSGFPLHSMLYRGNLDSFSNSGLLLLNLFCVYVCDYADILFLQSHVHKRPKHTVMANKRGQNSRDPVHLNGLNSVSSIGISRPPLVFVLAVYQEIYLTVSWQKVGRGSRPPPTV